MNMKYTEIKSCYIGPEISPEQFIPEHFFLYLAKGKIDGYDGNKHYGMQPGDACIVCKNHLARYKKQTQDDAFEKVVIIFDESFLKHYQSKYKIKKQEAITPQAFRVISKAQTIDDYIQSLQNLYNGRGGIITEKSDIKREELMSLLLQLHPEFIHLFFDFGKPGRLDLKAFMNKHYKFNVSLERFAFMTGRSLSAFKRDFVDIFSQTPSRWLIERRLQEAYFLITKKHSKPNDFYLDIGFEDLSHFSFAFKKQFGITPTDLGSDK